VRVGHTTLIEGGAELPRGEGPVRTGVTAILPNDGNIFSQRFHAGGFVLNGAGEVSGLTQVMEWGLLETPIALTNTLGVGQVSAGIVEAMIKAHPGIGYEHDVIIPVVGECDDSWLNDAGGCHVKSEHVVRAIESATGGPVEEGSVGGGTGMMAFDLKAGIGTSSRVLGDDEGGFTVGVLVQSNFGDLEHLRINGRPMGEELKTRMSFQPRPGVAGSIITVVATDAPLLPHQLNRLAKRAALGIGRMGSHAAHGSGEIVLSFSTANPVPRQQNQRVYDIQILSDAFINPLYEATVDATEEAILNSIFQAETMVGAAKRVASELPIDLVRELLQKD
jgi:D-aminopeptidase